MNGTMYVTQAGLLALQSAGLAGWTNLKCDLSTVSPSPPDFHAVIGDFSVPIYTGYAQAAVVLTGGYVNQVTLEAYALSGLIKFTGPSSGAGTDVPSFVLSDGTTHTVWAWGSFSNPKAEQLATDLVAFVVQLNEDATSVVTELV